MDARSKRAIPQNVSFKPEACCGGPPASKLGGKAANDGSLHSSLRQLRVRLWAESIQHRKKITRVFIARHAVLHRFILNDRHACVSSSLAVHTAPR